MKILHVVPSLDLAYGGPLRAVIDLSLRSRKFGVCSEILGLGPNGIEACGLDPSAIHSVPLDRPRRYCFSHALPAWLAKNLSHYDGVVLHGVWLYPNWAVRTACLQQEKPYACFPHGMLDPWPVNGQGLAKRLKKRAYWWLRERQVFQDCNCVFFTTQREMRLASKSFKIPKNQRVVVPYGVEGAPSKPFTVQGGSKVALFLGRVHPKKNVHFLLKAWLHALPPEPWKLVIAGPCDQVYRAQLDTILKKHKRESSVQFVGPVYGDAKAKLFYGATWFLLPSLQENFGIAVLEAISYGCPVAISNEVYLADQLHAKSEVLPLLEEKWIEFFSTRMQDDEWRAHLAELDRVFVRPQFEIETIASSWADTLFQVFKPKTLAA